MSSDSDGTVGESREGAVDASWLAVISDPLRLSVLGALCELGIASAAELRERSHISDRCLRRHLEALVALGLVEEQEGQSDGLTRGRPASRFVIEARIRERVAALFEALSEPLRV